MVMGQKMSVGVKVSIFNRLEYQLKKEQIRVLSILVQSSEKKRILPKSHSQYYVSYLLDDMLDVTRYLLTRQRSSAVMATFKVCPLISMCPCPEFFITETQS